MEIWHILDSRGIGGIETHVRIVADALNQAGHVARVVFLKRYGGPHPIEASLRADGIDVVYMDKATDLFARVLGENPDILHTHGYKANLLGRAIAVSTGTPAVSSFHAGEVVAGRLAVYTCLDRVTGIPFHKIAVSNAIAAQLKGSVTVLDNFVDIPTAVAPLTGRRIAFVGRLSWEKAPDRFCEIAESLPDVSADVYGDGPMRDDLERAFGDRVRFHGAVDTIGARLLETDLVVMPSRHEGLPMAALEAMARGVPVAATPVGGLPKLISDGGNGLLANAPTELRDRVDAFLNASVSTRRAMGSVARETVIQSFSPNAQLPKLLALYRRATAASEGVGHGAPA